MAGNECGDLLSPFERACGAGLSPLVRKDVETPFSSGFVSRYQPSNGWPIGPAGKPDESG